MKRVNKNNKALKWTNRSVMHDRLSLFLIIVVSIGPWIAFPVHVFASVVVYCFGRSPFFPIVADLHNPFLLALSIIGHYFPACLAYLIAIHILGEYS